MKIVTFILIFLIASLSIFIQPVFSDTDGNTITKHIKFSGGAYPESVDGGEYVRVEFKTIAARTPLIPEGFEGVAVQVNWYEGSRKGETDTVCIFPDSQFPSNFSGDLRDITKITTLRTSADNYIINIKPSDYHSSFKDVVILWGPNAGRTVRLHLFEYIDFVVEIIDNSESGE